MHTQIAEIAGQLNCCELQTTADGILIIHDWVVVEHEPITCVPETPPAAMANQDENIKQLSSDDEHGSSGSEMESYEAESQTDSCSGDEGDGDPLATMYSLTHTVTFKAMGTTKIHGAPDILLAGTYWTVAEMYQWNLYQSQIIHKITEQLLFDVCLMISGTHLAMLCLKFWMRSMLQSLCTR